jgi:FKBP-type peptidyl-prolyl cis-trans isomerase
MALQKEEQEKSMEQFSLFPFRTDRLYGAIVLLVCAMVSLQGCQTAPKPKSKMTYVLGRQIGDNLKLQNLTLNENELAAAIGSANRGEKSVLSAEETAAALSELREAVSSGRRNSIESSRKANSAFLSKNKLQPGVKTLNSGLQYISLREGSGLSPKTNDVVRVLYVGYLPNGQMFDSSYDATTPAEVSLDKAMPAWQEALSLMKIGGKMKIFFPPEMGFGSPEVAGFPADTVLIYELELDGVKK